MKITILGEEGVPVQVDGEAWIQPPGIVKIIHKNRAQMLTRDRVSAEAHIKNLHLTLCIPMSAACMLNQQWLEILPFPFINIAAGHSVLCPCC